MSDTVSTLAQKLRPFWLRDLGASTPAQSGGSGMVAHALSGPYHTGTLDASQAPWAVATTRTISAGNGLTGGGDLSANISFSLATTAAGNGLTYTGGVLDVGVSGLGLSVGADAITLTSSSDVSAGGTSILASNAGALTVGTLTASTKVRTGLLDTASTNLVIQPANDIVLDPQGNDVFPQNNYDINLGSLSLKFLTLHAAELWVETLVAQSTMATIGGRILVGPTTTLTRDLAPAATTIYVKHNQMVSGDRVYMEANGSVEFFAITSGPTGTGTDYSYTVTRNLDGTGANQWYAGDAMFNTGQTGGGFIDIYSGRGVKAATEYGPTIVGNVRLSSTYNDWAPRWAVGNLNGVFGYGTNVYGLAAGSATGANVTVEATNGVRLRQSSTDMIVLDASGNSYFAGVMTLGSSGEIRQGTGTLGSNYTGLRVWRDTNVGRIAGYSGDTLQWGAGTDGKLTAGADNVQMSADGMRIKATAVAPDTTARSILWAETLPNTDPTGEIYSWASAYNELTAVARNKSTTRGARGRYGSSVDGTFSAGMRTTSSYSGGAWSHGVDMYGNVSFNNDVSVLGDVSFLGRVSTEVPVRQHTTDNAWSIDAAGGTTVTAINGAVFQFSDNSTFSGMIIVNAAEGGAVALFMVGGGAVVKVADGSNVFTTTKDTASKNNLYYDAASSEYRLQNNTGSSRTYSIFSVRTRASS